MQLVSVITVRYPNGHSRHSAGEHVSADSLKSFCGREVAAVQTGTPSANTIGCFTCFKKWKKSQ